jgi:dihydrofolate reductase
VDSIDQALAVCPKDQDTYIIGGGEIYTLGLPYADKLDIRVHHSFEADTYFQISILKFGNFLVFNSKDDHHMYDLPSNFP